nr:copia protein [Tanacetum cinerariifolium]
FFFLVILIASSSTKSSSTKGDVLEGEGVSSNVMLRGIKASNDNPIPFYDPIVSGTPLNLTPSGERESDFFLEVDAFLAVEDEFTSSQFSKSYLDPKGHMLLFEAFLNNDHSSNFKTMSSSTSLNSLLEETNNFDNSLPEFTTFSNVLCDAECESDSSEDQSSSDEDILKKIVSKTLSEEEIIPMESLRTHDSSLSISSKIDSLLDEFAGELTLLKLIPPGIDETDCDFEEDIRLIEKLLYDNSSPRSPEEFVSVNSDASIKSFSSSPILVKASDSLMEEIELFYTPNYPMPPGIVDEDYDSERDILIPKDLPSNNSLSFAEKMSFFFYIPPFSRPLAKPPDGDTGFLNIKMMGDIYDQKAFMHKLMITLASHQEKSPDPLSHRCETVKKFNTHRSHLNTCPMLIHGQNNPILDVLLFHFYPLDSLKAKVAAIEKSKDLTSLSLDELIENHKVHKMIIKKDSKIVKEKVERKSLALKAKNESSNEDCSTFDSADEEYAMTVRDFKKFFKRRDKNQRVFVGGPWSDSGEKDDEKIKNKTCLVAQASSEDMCDEFAKIMHDEFKMSMMDGLNFFLGLQIKQLEDGIFFNQSKYVKETPKKFGLEDSKPMKPPCPLILNLRKMKNDYGIPKGTDIETLVYADSNHAGDYVDRKSTSGICTFVGCYLTSWFSKKQTTLAISTPEAEYVSARKACQQALWMKQALINYDVRLDNVPIMLKKAQEKDKIGLKPNKNRKLGEAGKSLKKLQ